MDLRTESAREDFRQARRQAAIQQVLDRLRRHPKRLLPFDEIRQGLRAEETQQKELREIPIDAIVGSVSRYEEYTRTFLPKFDDQEERWIKVREHIERSGLRPISVYQIGEAYFVSDGNHRVSVARQMRSKTIPAYVTQVKSRVDLSPDDMPSEIICKARYADFLEKTNLDKLRPSVDLLMTFPGQYRYLMEQIEAQQLLMNLDPVRENVPLSEAAAAWYDRAYKPLSKLIRQQGLQRAFPGLTEADLYLMVIRHRVQMRKALDWNVDLTAVTSDLMQKKGHAREQVIDRVGDRLLDMVTPDALEAGPAAGKWRFDRLDKRPTDMAFSDILVAIHDHSVDQQVLKHAILIASREQARLLALYVSSDNDAEHQDSGRDIQASFTATCAANGVRGDFAFETGSRSRKIIERAALTDLLVMGFVHQSKGKTAIGFGTQFNRILQRSPRPVLVIPEQSSSSFDRALLAYDGSVKADEALYLAAYIVRNWGGSVVVVVAGDELASSSLKEVRSYLSMRDVQAEYVAAQRPAYEAILSNAIEKDCDFIIMGGYGYRPIMQLVLGSTVTKVVRRSSMPVLVCR